MSIEIKDITFGYPNHKVFEKANLILPNTGLYALLGLNGAGKSTLFSLIMHQLKPTCGKIYIDGLENDKLTPRQRALKLAMVFSSKPRIDISAKELLDNTALLIGKPWDVKQFENWGLEELLPKKLTECSEGQLQKLMLARAMVQHTPILLLDEPTQNLDYLETEKMDAILLEISQEKLVFYSTHRMEDALQYSNGIVGIADHSLIDLTNKSFEEIKKLTK